MLELLTRLNPKVQNIADVTGSGFDSLTPEDIAHALGGLAEGPYQMGLVCHCDASPQALIVELYDRIKNQAKPIAGAYVNALCHIAIAEVLGDNLCSECCGRSFIFAQAGDKSAMRSPDGLLVKPCHACNETGKQRMTDKEKAEIISEAIGEPLTTRQYQDRYSWDADKAFMVANGWLHSADSHIIQILADEP